MKQFKTHIPTATFILALLIVILNSFILFASIRSYYKFKNINKRVSTLEQIINVNSNKQKLQQQKMKVQQLQQTQK